MVENLLTLEGIPTEDLETQIVKDVFSSIEKPQELVERLLYAIDEQYPASDQCLWYETEESIRKRNEYMQLFGGVAQQKCSDHECGDVNCPHKGNVNPLAAFFLSEAPSGMVIDLEKWTPFEYPAFRIDRTAFNIFDHGLRNNLLPDLKGRANVYRFVIRYKFKNEQLNPIPRLGYDFVEGILYTREALPRSVGDGGGLGNASYTPSVTELVANGKVVKIQHKDRYCFLGMIPIYNAVYTDLGITPRIEQLEYGKEVEVDLVCHRFCLQEDLHKQTQDIRTVFNAPQRVECISMDHAVYFHEEE